jgi:RNA polymerase sigma factor (sigma-70 family)
MVATVGAGQRDDVADSDVIQASLDVPERFGALHERHAAVLYRYAYQRVGAAAAEDVVAETFLAAFAERHRYDLTRASARPWLFGILTNKISRWGRAERAHQRMVIRAGQSPVLEGMAERVADQVSAQAERGRLMAALRGLSRADRDVVLLVAWGQLSYDEVAEALGIPAGTVGSRMNRARRKLRESLAEQE